MRRTSISEGAVAKACVGSIACSKRVERNPGFWDGCVEIESREAARMESVISFGSAREDIENAQGAEDIWRCELVWCQRDGRLSRARRKIGWFWYCSRT